MRRAILFAAFLAIAAGIAVVQSADATANSGKEVPPTVETTQDKRIFIRTENYPRPPYSGATYYIYERDDEIICTKLQVCNKYDDCDVTYKKGAFKEEEDIETGEPYGTTERVLIPASKLRKHVCLTKFKLIR
ncbi:MAG: hypothetical protein AB7J13_15650 [Pyrinomonadaceae bacterium]